MAALVPIAASIRTAFGSACLSICVTLSRCERVLRTIRLSPKAMPRGRQSYRFAREVFAASYLSEPGSPLEGRWRFHVRRDGFVQMIRGSPQPL